MKNDGKLMHRWRLHLTKWGPFLLILILATACGTSIAVNDDFV